MKKSSIFIIGAAAILKDIESIEIENNCIIDISPLKNLASLKSLEISHNQLKNIQPLSSLYKLEYIDISDNEIADISALKGLENLSGLSICNNPVKDISVLSNLKKLKQLSLYGAVKITDYNCIRELYDNLSYKDFDINEQQAIADKLREAVAISITPGMTDYEKVLAIHDYIVSHTKYDMESLVNNDYLPARPYGVLVYGRGICAGYASTFQLFMDYLDIECFFVVGTVNDTGSDVNHDWNIVKVDGKYRHVDVTWDDYSHFQVEEIYHDYFCLTDEQISMKYHSWDRDLYPKCSD